MQPRFYIGTLANPAAGDRCELPEGAARHVQVLRMQPGDALEVFDGEGAAWRATVLEMGRRHVAITLSAPLSVDAELPVRVTLALGMPANDRMDGVIEKAAELGVHAVQPLVCDRSVLRLDGERAAKKVAHWQAVAVSACEQSGRAVVPQIRPVQALGAWLRGDAVERHEASWRKALLSPQATMPLRTWAQPGDDDDRKTLGRDRGGFVFLSGPEGGLSPTEEQAARQAGWAAVSLGRRVLRADTAPLAALSVIGALWEGAVD